MDGLRNGRILAQNIVVIKHAHHVRIKLRIFTSHGCLTLTKLIKDTFLLLHVQSPHILMALRAMPHPTHLIDSLTE